MKQFNYQQYRKSMCQVNFLLRPQTVEGLQPMTSTLLQAGNLPSSSVPCLMKFAIKFTLFMFEKDPKAVLLHKVAKGEL